MVELSPEEIDEVMSFDEQNALNGEDLGAGQGESKVSTAKETALATQ